ncbi:MAG TPA: hypothetical protein VG897_04480 [Terriglobales bacterium]|nr:hypothetical protein [Terriglobales bacterium]
MTPIEIEGWALRTIATVERGQAFEDSRIELKKTFPTDPKKAARRIAAHANSAMGEPILWLIGIDQSSGITGASSAELSSWFSGVKAEFDEVYPPMRDVVIHSRGKMVIALQFETDRAPYLVKNPSGGTIQREVPWREGTQTRTATRDELILILQPPAPIPSFEIISAHLAPSGDAHLQASMRVYIVPRTNDRVTIPFHRCSGRVVSNGKIACSELKVVSYRPGSGSLLFRASLLSANPTVNLRGYESIEYEPGQVIIHRPGYLTFSVSGPLSGMNYTELQNPTLELRLGVASRDGFACHLSSTLGEQLRGDKGKDGPAGWRFRAATKSEHDE